MIKVEDAIANLQYQILRFEEGTEPYIALQMAIEALEERKTGKWIEKDGWDGDVYYDCSACSESWITIEGTPWDNGMNYCPHCGAKMKGE